MKENTSDSSSHTVEIMKKMEVRSRRKQSKIKGRGSKHNSTYLITKNEGVVLRVLLFNSALNLVHLGW